MEEPKRRRTTGPEGTLLVKTRPVGTSLVKAPVLTLGGNVTVRKKKVQMVKSADVSDDSDSGSDIEEPDEPDLKGDTKLEKNMIKVFEKLAKINTSEKSRAPEYKDKDATYLFIKNMDAHIQFSKASNVKAAQILRTSIKDNFTQHWVHRLPEKTKNSYDALRNEFLLNFEKR